MNNELQALEDNGTWKLTGLPPNRRAIGLMVNQCKAGLVILSCRKQKGVEEIFARVAKMTTVRACLTVASLKTS